MKTKTKTKKITTLQDLSLKKDISLRCYHFIKSLMEVYTTVEELKAYIDQNNIKDVLSSKCGLGYGYHDNIGFKTMNELFVLLGKKPPYREVVKVQKVITYVLNRDYDV